MLKITKALQIPGWMEEQELLWLASAAHKAQNIVEIGSWRGRSARAFADNTFGTVTCVDTWDDKAIGIQGWWSTPQDRNIQQQKDWLWDEFRRNLCDYNCKVKAMRMPSVSAARILFEQGRKFDLIFIDADHSLEAVKQDITIWSQLLTGDGILCGHDYGHPLCPEVKPAVDELLPKVNVTGTIWSVA